jgi:hypothetical protein
MTHSGLLKRVHNSQKTNTPWYTGRGFTVCYTNGLPQQHIKNSDGVSNIQDIFLTI